MSTPTKLKTSAMIASFADPGQKTTPAPFGHAMVTVAEADPRIVGLTADLGKYTDMHIFAQAFPERYFQMGHTDRSARRVPGRRRPAHPARALRVVDGAYRRHRPGPAIEC
jgi:deoxyxylulose-5-phosphate synthase